MKIEDMPLSTKTIKTITKRVLKDRDMHIVRRFSPVISEYKLQLSPELRQIFKITDDEFLSRKEILKNGKWIMQSEIYSFGPLEKLENALSAAISKIIN